MNVATIAVQAAHQIGLAISAVASPICQSSTYERDADVSSNFLRVNARSCRRLRLGYAQRYRSADMGVSPRV